MTNMVNPSLGHAVIDVLERHDCEVVIPTNVQCCGTPHLAYGGYGDSRPFLPGHNIKLLLDAQPDFIVADCATCGGTLKEYDKLIPEAETFTKKVYDISEFLVNRLDIKLGSKLVEAVATYHDSCHLSRGQGVTAQPREILKSIPGLVFREMPEADRCCGGAGSFCITHYDVSSLILDRKIRNIKSVAPDIVATGCPACKMQIEHGIARHGLAIRVFHPLELLAQTYKDG
ncbi:protein of unknown function DUF224, cysteine-rich region domain protein [Thermosinus carboxydivorans Nor1]|uniref:Cysteine-rich domain-containing protein n=2 Tax=Thermosinus TaxID=261684 RepID=A1HUI9_9FIRM|nr:protein of unknown function DUF224, cysteine-rich region domain protein [Thermosinus carboxydivorans Nor1]